MFSLNSWPLREVRLEHKCFVFAFSVSQTQRNSFEAAVLMQHAASNTKHVTKMTTKFAGELPTD